MEPVSRRELQLGARIADALVYAAGVAGIVAGGLLFREGQPGFAIVAWTLTFVAGASLRLAAAMARAIGVLMARSERLEEAVADLSAGTPEGSQRPTEKEDGPPDPYRRWGGWH